MKTKTCSRCNQAKALDDFKSDSRKPDGKASSCKACNAAPKVGDLQAMRNQLVVATPHEIMPPILMTDAGAWALLINARWRESAEKIIDAGRYLIAAKAALPHGEFGDMIGTKLSFSASTAQRLMAIAGDLRLSNPAHVQHLPPAWGTLYEITKLSDDEFDQAIERRIIRPDMERREVESLRPRIPRIPEPAESTDLDYATTGGVLIPSMDVERLGEDDAGETRTAGASAASSPALLAPGEPASVEGACGHAPPEFSSPLPNGSRAIMGSRQEDADSLDFFPTPPWATRALIERVFTHLGRRGHCKWQMAWEPACGEGHMAEVLSEYFKTVRATDIENYGYSDWPLEDFLNTKTLPGFDWIITNPPFGDVGEAFVLKAIDFATTGVAMFMRVQWLDSIGRYERVFRDTPPTLIAFFAERVNLCKGRWDPEGSTATAYMWLVWIKGAEPRAPFWIPPGQREGLTKPDDVERFTQHPVKRNSNPASQRAQVAGPNSKAQCPTLPGCEAADDSQQRSRDFSNEDEAA